MRKYLVISAIFLTTTSYAGGSFKCNEHGAVVTLADGTVYYMGKNCDAAQKGGGTGRWWLAASAFVVEIDGLPKRLPFEVDCDLPACWSES